MVTALFEGTVTGACRFRERAAVIKLLRGVSTMPPYAASP